MCIHILTWCVPPTWLYRNRVRTRIIVITILIETGYYTGLKYTIILAPVRRLETLLCLAFNAQDNYTNTYRCNSNNIHGSIHYIYILNRMSLLSIGSIAKVIACELELSTRMIRTRYSSVKVKCWMLHTCFTWRKTVYSKFTEMIHKIQYNVDNRSIYYVLVFILREH